MTRLATLLLATTAIAVASQASADVYLADQEEQPFFWTEESESAEEATVEASPPPSKPAPEAPQTRPSASPKSAPPSPNPLMDAYPVADAPTHDIPEASESRYLDQDCDPEKFRPSTMRVEREPMSREGERASGDRTRRGETAGDDGVLESIQDSPCSVIHRRGGETAESAREYTHPHDIRRANTLEERRIPRHEVAPFSSRITEARPKPGISAGGRHGDGPFIEARREWIVRKGDMLSDTLMAWGEEAGFDVIWRSPHDYVLRASVTLRGDFEEASSKVIESFARANPPIAAEFFTANRVLVVDSGDAFDGR